MYIATPLTATLSMSFVSLALRLALEIHRVSYAAVFCN